MSRRTDLLQQLIQSDKFGDEKEQEQKFLAATAELIKEKSVTCVDFRQARHSCMHSWRVFRWLEVRTHMLELCRSRR